MRLRVTVGLFVREFVCVDRFPMYYSRCIIPCVLFPVYYSLCIIPYVLESYRESKHTFQNAACALVSYALTRLYTTVACCITAVTQPFGRDFGRTDRRINLKSAHWRQKEWERRACKQELNLFSISTNLE